MSIKTATLIGATGLVGNELLHLLLEDPYFETVRILVRKPVGLQHPRLEKKLVDFTDADSMLVALDNSQVVFCAVGTTSRKVKGDKAAYRKVDYDIPVNAARFCKMTGCEKFILVSSMGANSRSSNFYARLKGEVEDEVKKIGLKSVHIMRPSLLLGKRNEFRLGEKIAQILMTVYSFLIPIKYKAIPAKDVAKAMLNISKTEKPGFYIYENRDISTTSTLV